MDNVPTTHDEITLIIEDWRSIIKEYNKDYVYMSYEKDPYINLEVPVVEDNNDSSV